MGAPLNNIDHGSKLAPVITYAHQLYWSSRLFASSILACLPSIRIYSTTILGYTSDLIPLILHLLLFIFYSPANLVTLAAGAGGFPAPGRRFDSGSALCSGLEKHKAGPLG